MIEQLEPVGHFCHRIIVGQLVQRGRAFRDPLLEDFVGVAQREIGVPLAAERRSELSAFHGMKRLSEKENFVGRRHLYAKIVRFCAN